MDFILDLVTVQVSVLYICAGDSHGSIWYSVLSVCLSHTSLKNTLREFLQIWCKHQLGPLGSTRQFRFWFSEVKVSVTSQNTFLTIARQFI